MKALLFLLLPVLVIINTFNYYISYTFLFFYLSIFLSVYSSIFLSFYLSILFYSSLFGMSDQLAKNLENAPFGWEKSQLDHLEQLLQQPCQVKATPKRKMKTKPELAAAQQRLALKVINWAMSRLAATSHSNHNFGNNENCASGNWASTSSRRSKSTGKSLTGSSVNDQPISQSWSHGALICYRFFYASTTLRDLESLNLKLWDLEKAHYNVLARLIDLKQALFLFYFVILS